MRPRKPKLLGRLEGLVNLPILNHYWENHAISMQHKHWGKTWLHDISVDLLAVITFHLLELPLVNSKAAFENGVKSHYFQGYS